MSKCICIGCINKCSEYNSSLASDKNYYEWSLKEDKCNKDAEQIMKIERKELRAEMGE